MVRRLAVLIALTFLLPATAQAATLTVDGGTLTYTAAPGSYLLQLVATSQDGTCGQTSKPSFGWNQGGAMGFQLVGP